jgi:hypothetical protein
LARTPLLYRRKLNSKQSLKAVHHILASSAETRRSQ